MGTPHRSPSRKTEPFARAFRAARSACVSVAVMLSACSADPPQPTLVSISPPQGYTDQVTAVRIAGRDFLPAYVFDLQERRTSVQQSGFSGDVSDATSTARLTNIVWRSTTLIEATLDKGLAGGPIAYNVTLVDPRGQKATLPNGFVSLGPDKVPPEITVFEPQPDRLVAPGNSVRVDFSARDVAPGSLADVTYKIVWNDQVLAIGGCELSLGDEPTRCKFDAQVPPLAVAGQKFVIQLNAIDASSQGTITAKELSFILVPAPVLASIEPARGRASGGTDVVVVGSNLPPDAQVFIGGAPLLPNGGTRLDGQTIVGRTPPGKVGRASVEIRALTGISILSKEQDFAYQREMSVLDVNPISAPSEGGVGVRVTGIGFTPFTRIIFGDRATTGAVLLEPAPLIRGAMDSTTIEGIVPPGVGKTFVWAVDPELGKARWIGTFTWTPTL